MLIWKVKRKNYYLATIKIVEKMGNRVKIQMEFAVRSSPTILFTYLSTPSGLSEWFADNVNVKGKTNYIFIWDKTESHAELLRMVTNKLIKLKWVDGGEDEYFEIEIVQDDLTNDVALLITDFADEGEEESVRELWSAQVDALRKSIGA